MSFDWSEYFSYAENIFSDISVDECSCRVGISRFYYSAYHKAKQYALFKSIHMLSGGSEHEKLWNSLAQSEEDNARRMASLGNTLKRLRKISDYDAGHSIDRRQLEIAYNCAKKIFDLCRM